MNDLSVYAYQGHPSVFKVSIAGIDVTARIDRDSLLEVSQALDYPELNSWEPSECEFALIDPDGEFSTDNENNFFVSNGHPQSGNLVDVNIETGFNVDGVDQLDTLFSGKITKVSQNADDGLTTIVANDELTELFSKDITDFGINRHFRIELRDNQGVHGVYPISDFMLPISQRSVTVKKNATDDFTEVDQIAETGVFNRENYIVGENSVLSEYISFPDVAVGYPQLVAKGAYHDRDVKHIIDDLLTHIGITEKSVDFPEIIRGINISRNERIGYQVVGNPDHNELPADIATWKGYPTDMVVDGDNYYILYNAPPERDLADKPDSMLLKYVKGQDTWHVLYRAKTEMWKLAKSGSKIAILCTDSILIDAADNDYFVPDQTEKPRAGSYDATVGVASSYIQLHDETTNINFTLVPKTATLKPQVGQYYIFGATPYQRIGEGYQIQKVNDIVPDTVRNIAIHNGFLYYFYGEAVPQRYHGVAKVDLDRGTPIRMSQIESDGRNHLGGNIIVADNKVFYLGTSRTGADSQLFVASMNA